MIVPGAASRVAGLGVLLLAAACGGGPGAAPAPVAAAEKPAARAESASDPYAVLVADDPHGRPVPFRDFAGKVRVIDIWASWCGPCRMTIPELNDLYERFRSEGLVVIGLSVDDDAADVLEFQRNMPMRYPNGMFNRGLAVRIGEPSSIPTTLLVDRKGVLRRTFVGYVDVATPTDAIRGLL